MSVCLSRRTVLATKVAQLIWQLAVLGSRLSSVVRCSCSSCRLGMMKKGGEEGGKGLRDRAGAFKGSLILPLCVFALAVRVVSNYTRERES